MQLLVKIAMLAFDLWLKMSYYWDICEVRVTSQLLKYRMDSINTSPAYTLVDKDKYNCNNQRRQDHSHHDPQPVEFT